MMQTEFVSIVTHSPVLSDPVKEVLREASSAIGEAGRGAIVTALVAYERQVLAGSEEFLNRLDKGEIL